MIDLLLFYLTALPTKKPFEDKARKYPKRIIVESHNAFNIKKAIAVIPWTYAEKAQYAATYKLSDHDRCTVEESTQEYRPMFDFIVDRTDKGGHSVDGKHPDGSSAEKSCISVKEGFEGCEEYFHAPAGQSAEHKFLPVHFISFMYKQYVHESIRYTCKMKRRIIS